MIASVTFLASRHPTDRWYSCRTNQVSEKSIAIRFAGSCPITWRAISRLSSDFVSRSTFGLVITAGLCTTACGTSCACWATKRLSNCPKASASVCTIDCFRSAELLSASTAPFPLVHLLDPVHQCPRIETCGRRDFFLSLPLRIGITPPDSMNGTEHNLLVEASNLAVMQMQTPHSNRGVADAQTGRLGISTSSLA